MKIAGGPKIVNRIVNRKVAPVQLTSWMDSSHDAATPAQPHCTGSCDADKSTSQCGHIPSFLASLGSPYDLRYDLRPKKIPLKICVWTFC